MKKKTSNLTRVLTILLVLLFCLALSALAGIIVSLPDLATKEFGPASAEMHTGQRIITAARLFWNRDLLLEPADPNGVAREFEIELGEPVGKVAARMQAQGILRDAEAFRMYLVYSGLDKSIQAGKYSLSPAMCAVDLARALQDATPTEVSFVILPGWRLEEVAASLPTSGLDISPEDFLAAARNPENIPGVASLPVEGSLEGFLFPGEYRLSRNASIEGVFAAILNRFNQQVDPELRATFERRELSLRDAVILASIVQRESMVEEERPMIASVFLNRLASGMKLDSDPTVQYAVGFDENQKSWWVNPLTLEHLEIQSPYNTYQNPGLPPGPICSPGQSSLKAVAYPAETPYHYFRALCDGSGKHAFAVTYEEHLKNGCP